MTKQESIIRVHFHVPGADGKTDYFFGGLSAIYEQFTLEQVGCTVQHLWNYGIDFDHPYQNKLCVISKEVFTRKTCKTH